MNEMGRDMDMGFDGAPGRTGFARSTTDWGFVVAPGAAPEPGILDGRGARRAFGAALALLAAAAATLPFWTELPATLALGAALILAMGAGWYLRPRRPVVQIEIEVDVAKGEIRVVECDGTARNVVSREPLGTTPAIELGGAVHTLPTPRTPPPAA